MAMQQPNEIPFSDRQLVAFIVAEIKGRVATDEAVHLPTVVGLAVDYVLGNRELARAFAASHLKELVYAIGQRYVAKSRGALTVIGDDIQDRETFIQEAGLRWPSWLEHTGGRYVPALAMTRDECHQAAAQHFMRGERELVLGKLWRLVGDQLQEGQQVRDVWTVEKLEEAHQHIQARQLTLSRNDRTWAARLLGRRDSLGE